MNDIKFNCPQCGNHLLIDISAAGQTVTCPHCNAAIGVPFPPSQSTLPAGVRHKKRFALGWIWALAGILVLGAIGAGLVLFLPKSPGRIVKKYIAARQSNNIAQSLQWVTPESAKNMKAMLPLLEKEVIPTNLVIEVVGEQVQQDRAKVQVRFTREGVSSQEEIPLERIHGQWRLDLSQHYFAVLVANAPWLDAGEQAGMLYAKAKSFGETNGWIWGKLGLMLFDATNYTEALDAFRRATESKHPAWGFAGLVWQGHILDLQNRRDEALARYREANALPKKKQTMRHDQYGIVLSQKWLEARLERPFRGKTAADNAPPHDPGLLAWWPGNGDAEDLIGGFHGRPNSGVTFAQGQSGQCFQFDGTTNAFMWTRGGDLDHLYDNFTTAFWAYPTAGRAATPEKTSGVTGASGQRFVLFPLHGGDKGPAGTGISVGTNGVSVFEHADNYLPSVLVYNTALKGWTHVAVVYENRKPRLYLNGQLTRVAPKSPRAHVFPSKMFGIDDSHGAFRGRLEEVRLYNRALSEPEIQALVTAVRGDVLVPAPTALTTPTAKPSDDERLKQVKALYEQGLISKEAYDKKVKAIINSL